MGIICKTNGPRLCTRRLKQLDKWIYLIREQRTHVSFLHLTIKRKRIREYKVVLCVVKNIRKTLHLIKNLVD